MKVRLLHLNWPVLALVGLAATGGDVGAQESEYWGSLGHQVVNLKQSIAASSFPAVQLGWASPAFSESGGAQSSIVCLVTAKLDGKKVSPSGVTLGGDVLNLDTAEVLASLSEKTRPFSPDARFSWGLPDFSASFADEEELALGVFIQGSLEGGQQVDLLQTQCRAQKRIPCMKGETTACLLSGDRFEVQVSSRGAIGRVSANGFNSAVFSFGAGHRVTVQVLNGCNQNGHFWVNVDPETNLPFDIVIEDTQTGDASSYQDPESAGTDLAAFATCP